METVSTFQYLLVFAISLMVIGLAFKFFGKTGNRRHHRNIVASHRRLTKLEEIGREGGIPAQLAYLRKVDPYVFEEMILTAIERKTHGIKRNSSYSGDGGLDGEFSLKGEKVLIQAKRYKDCISTQHVRDFMSLCESKGVRGIFVHTGKTPKPAFELVSKTRVEILSGQKLIRLLTI